MLRKQSKIVVASDPVDFNNEAEAVMFLGWEPYDTVKWEPMSSASFSGGSSKFQPGFFWQAFERTVKFPDDPQGD